MQDVAALCSWAVPEAQGMHRRVAPVSSKYSSENRPAAACRLGAGNTKQLKDVGSALKAPWQAGSERIATKSATWHAYLAGRCIRSVPHVPFGISQAKAGDAVCLDGEPPFPSADTSHAFVAASA